MSGILPVGVRLAHLDNHLDHRGALTEVFRQSRDSRIAPAQWNVTFSFPGVLRGVHLHLHHTDYIVVVQGRADVGLLDVRHRSPTEGLALLVEMHGGAISGLTIPPGILHGLYFHEPTTVMYGLSEEWDPADDLACHWADPDLGIPWKVTSATISQRDAEGPRLSELLAEIERFQPIGGPLPAREHGAESPADARYE